MSETLKNSIIYNNNFFGCKGLNYLNASNVVPIILLQLHVVLNSKLFKAHVISKTVIFSLPNFKILK
jgi:hypothetical protein